MLRPHSTQPSYRKRGNAIDVSFCRKLTPVRGWFGLRAVFPDTPAQPSREPVRSSRLSFHPSPRRVLTRAVKYPFDDITHTSPHGLNRAQEKLSAAGFLKSLRGRESNACKKFFSQCSYSSAIVKSVSNCLIHYDPTYLDCRLYLSLSWDSAEFGLLSVYVVDRQEQD